MELVQAMRNISVSGRVGLLFSVSMIAMLAALAACDDSAPANSTKVRPGAERQIGASNALPASAYSPLAALFLMSMFGILPCAN